jgi:hemerythrin
MALAFEQLERALCAHFENEEKIAQAVDFDFSKHRLAQQYGLKELRFLRDELAAKDCLWSEGAVKHFTHFLETWMIDEHIIGLDMQMCPALQAYDYEFWPNLRG